MRGSMLHHQVHTPLVLLMRQAVKITSFTKYNKCERICLVSTDARTYRQLWPVAARPILTINSAQMRVSNWFQNHHLATLFILQQWMDDARNFKNSLCPTKISHWSHCKKGSFRNCLPMLISQLFGLQCVRAGHTDSVQPFTHISTRVSRGRDGAFNGADRYLTLVQCDLFPELGRGRSTGRSIWFG